MSSQLGWPAEINLDRASREPLSGQLAAALERRISSGALPEGARLPATRDLAVALKINRGTVQAAYRHLQEAGLARGRVGSGTVVHAPVSPSPFDADSLLSARVTGLSPEDSPAAGAPLIADFSRLTPDERFFPLEEFTRTLSEAWGRRPDLWQYAPPLGFEDLRREISGRLSEQGLHRSPDEILVTSGAQQGLDLVFRTFTDPGDVVVTESPTYSGALALARFAGVRIVELPMEPDGPDARPLLATKAKLVYLMPERQNPTGVTTDETRRAEIAEAVAASGALLVEDGYEEPESGLKPLAARLPDRTIWLGTLSKDLVPGFRIGWIAGPAAIIERLARVKKTADFQTPLPLQAAVAAFLREGGDRRARRARAFDVEAKRISAARLLKAHLPELSWWGGEIGSALFWLHLPPQVSGRRVAQAAAARGVGVAPGADFDPRGEDRANVRLSVSRVDKRSVEQGIRLLAEAVRAVQSASGAHSMPVV
ncbi:MAG TPA: PLP-dependent aminotransferase family protein [Thermoanaerobaculia bacterium]|nr:PLP-dependent aminotransferase family protein [Thermoanaerobaculia bacterium]